VPAAAFDRVVVDLQQGNIRVTDLTRSGALAAGSTVLTLRTARGHIQPAR
jgi:hypothetical protein